MIIGNSLRMLAHYPDCKHTDNMLDENRHVFETLEEAELNGFKLCFFCKATKKKLDIVATEQ